MLGRLTLDALPFYSPIAFGGALVIVLGGLAVLFIITRAKAWGMLWSDWFTTVDHKRLGIMYVILAAVMGLRAFVDALMMRLQQAVAFESDGYLPPDHYDQIFSSHGTIMILFMAMPFATGLMNYIVPLQIGSRDVAFPKLNAISFWLTAAGAALVMASLVIGRFSTAGWTAYPPYSGAEYSPYVGVDYWIWAALLSGVGSTLTGINFVVTILRKRAPGMTLMRMPLFTWTALCASLMMAFAFPAITVSSALLALDRIFGMHFFTADAGGNMMNYANLLWMWGHPEVYVLVLPAFGVFSSVVTTFAGRQLFGYPSLVYATCAIAILAFTVWLHHFFTMGAGADVNAFFGIATMIIAVPTGVKVINWVMTLYRGRIRFSVAMLYTLGFMVTFVIGGMTGVLLSLPPVDYALHNSEFLVAHFHNMLVPGALFGYLAGYNLWFPKVFGFALDERWGRRGFWLTIAGFYLTFMPLYALGFMGMPRRMEHFDVAGWLPWLIVAAIGVLAAGAGIACMLIQLWVSIRDRKKNPLTAGDPFDGRTLEWATASPPAPYNFAVIPTVRSRDAFLDMKLRGEAYRKPDRYEDILMPRPSAFGMAIGATAFVVGFGMVWHIWWLAALALLAVVAVLAFYSSRDETDLVIPAAEVERIEEARLTAARRAPLPADGVTATLRAQAVGQLP